MSRREVLEKEVEIARERLDNATPDIPEDVVKAWRREYDSLSFELNNLYDDMSSDDPGL